MYVGNLVINWWCYLFFMNIFFIIIVGMVYFDDIQIFKVFVCGCCEDDNFIIEVYDLVEDSWILGGFLVVFCKYGGDILVWCDGVFYCFIFFYSILNFIVYDFVKGIWFDVFVYMLLVIMFFNVVVCYDKFLLIYVMEVEEGYFVIWVLELDFDIYEWVEVERMFF